MTPVSREALAGDLLPHLTSTGHLVGLAARPAGGGGDPSGAFTPYAILYPQPTIFEPTLASAHAGDATVMQLTCVATSPTVAMRVADDLTALAIAAPDTLAGRPVVDVRVVTSRGPDRDPDDDRLWFCIVQPAVRTHV